MYVLYLFMLLCTCLNVTALSSFGGIYVKMAPKLDKFWHPLYWLCLFISLDQPIRFFFETVCCQVCLSTLSVCQTSSNLCLIVCVIMVTCSTQEPVRTV